MKKKKHLYYKRCYQRL